MKKAAPFTILYEDESIVAVNKASGIAVTADRWDDSRERLDKLLAAFLHLESLYIVHRIDRDTSGVVVFAKDAPSHKVLSRAFENRRVQKRYIALSQGRPAWRETVCELSLAPDGNKRHLTIIDNYQGKPSRTRFRLAGIAGNYSVIEAFPETGRTHQIRVHLASLGHPVVCDNLYGSAKPVFLSAFKGAWRGDPAEERPLLSRLGLHAAGLLLPYKDLALEAPLPRDIAALVNQMEKAGKFSLAKTDCFV